MYACTIAFLLWMVVLNQLVPYLLVLHRGFLGLLVDFNSDRRLSGRKNGKITCNKLP